MKKAFKDRIPDFIKEFCYRHSFGFSLLPFQFTVNIANICNRKCKFCNYHAPENIQDDFSRWWKAQPKFMNYELFAGMLRRMGLLRLFINQLVLTGKGEPMMHPDFIKFCKLLNELKIYFSITTDGDYLNPYAIFQLSKLKYLRYVRISVYDVKRVPHWKDLQKNANIPILLFNETGQHFDDMIEGFVICNNDGTDQYATIPKDFNKAKSCRVPFAFNTMNTDGSIVPCYGYFETGNVFTGTLWNAWNGKRMREIRMKALDMKAEKCPCLNCGYFVKYYKK